MIRNIAFAVTLLFSSLVNAEPTIFNFPYSKSDFGLVINLPNLVKTKEKGNVDENYQFNGVSDNFIVSFFVEKQKSNASTNDSVYKYYWPLAIKNPLIDESSVVKSETSNYVKVESSFKDIGQNKINVKNFNYYLVASERLVDVHISITNQSEKDKEILIAFENSLVATNNVSKLMSEAYKNVTKESVIGFQDGMAEGCMKATGNVKFCDCTMTFMKNEMTNEEWQKAIIYTANGELQKQQAILAPHRQNAKVCK